MDSLSRNCSNQYDIATDYFATASTSSRVEPESCDSWSAYNIRPEAIELLREDGLCADNAVNSTSEASWPEGGIGWDSARDYVGTYQRVCGPLASLRNTDDGAFLNIGQDYPSIDRFTFIIWGFKLNQIEGNATICAAGDVYIYEGVTQVELGSADEIEIWR